MSFLNPISPIQVGGQSSVLRTSTFGTTFSNNVVGGYMQVNYLTDLIYTIPTGTTGNIEYSGNTIPINFLKGTGSSWSPDVLTLNSDNLSSGRRKIGMLVYVREEDQVYQYTNDSFITLWNAATAATNTVVISDFGTTVNNSTVAGQNFINSWTASTIDGYNGVVRSNAVWKKYYGTNLALTGASFNSGTGTLTLTNITGGTQTLSGFGSGGGGGSSITGGTFDVSTLELDLNSTGSTVTINNVTGLYISAGTYSSSTSTILLYNSTGGTINITGVTASGGSFTGGTVTGSTIFTNGLSANTISATTYQNLPQSVSGTGTQDYVTKWDGSLVGLVDSQIYDTGGFIGIATTTPLYSETLSIQTGNQGITIDALYIRDAGGSLAFGTNFDYSAWGSGGGEIAIGTRGVLSNSTGSGNIGIGDKALESNTTGINNIAIGSTGALTYNDSGSDNIAIGYQASLFNNDASGNVAIGGESLYNNTSGNRNTVLGYSAGYSNQGGNNVYLGYSSGYYNDGNGNIFIGYAAGYGDTSSSNRLNIGDTIFGDISSKLVGINQITPETTLDVNGTTRITGGLTASTISATTYQNLPGSSSSNCFGTFYTSAISGCSPVTILTPLNLTEGINVTGTTNFTNTVDFSGGLTASTISATTYQNLPISGLTQGSNVTITNNGNGNYTITSTGGGGLTFQQVQMVAFLST